MQSSICFKFTHLESFSRSVDGSLDGGKKAIDVALLFASSLFGVGDLTVAT